MLHRVVGSERPVNLEGKTVVIVGASSGIGEATARQVAAAGARLVITGRNMMKLEQLASALRSSTAERVHTVYLDLTDLNSVVAAARRIHEVVDVIHILVANAGVLYMGSKRQVTPDGWELMMGVNHVGNAALILALKDLVCAAAPSRIAIVSSIAHQGAGTAPLDDLMSERGFSGMQAYGRSKLANILFARELGRRWQSAGVTVYAVHPGATNTPIMSAFAGNWISSIIMRLIRSLILTPEQAAQGILRVAADPALDEPTGTYFERGRPKPGSELSNDPVLARNLWDVTLRLLSKYPDLDISA